jgi:ribosomal protein S18 acetylase RimI-like enzyme
MLGVETIDGHVLGLSHAISILFYFSPWKEAQIAYLKMLQGADLKRRRERYPVTNQMFLAYQVLEAEASTALSRPLILDLNRVYNLPRSSRSRSNGQEYVRGDMLGFVEITQRSYGLGQGQQQPQVDEMETLRPVLTNLAVSSEARQSGIGSQLLEECERHIVREWNLNEVVLEVEDYNTNALEFYGKRGYHVVFSDPASRRYDVNGLVLRKVRCTRAIMRKTLTVQQQQREETITNGPRTLDFFQIFRQTVGV